MTEAHSTSWLQSLIPTSASWGVIAAELAVLFFLLAVIFGWFARRGRKRRIQAAADLLAERDDMADVATQTMAMHLKALLSGQDPSDADLVDYNKRSRKLIGALCQPWLEPSKGALRDAAHEILAIRHTDLHQFAGILGSPQVKESEEDKAALESTRQELGEAKKAEALRSKQLQEALTTIGTMVAEYGRKFEASTDSRTGQVLRALIYLQALDEGNAPERAKEIVDETLSEDLEVLKDQQENQVPETPDASAVAAAAAAEAADLSTELDAEAEMAAAMAEEAQTKNEETPEPEVAYDDDFDDLESIESLESNEHEEPETETPDIEAMEQAAVSSAPPEDEAADAAPGAMPEAPSMGGLDELDALDDIDALIAQAQTKIDEQIDEQIEEPVAEEIETPPMAEVAAEESPPVEESPDLSAEPKADTPPAPQESQQAPAPPAAAKPAAQAAPKPEASAAPEQVAAPKQTKSETPQPEPAKTEPAQARAPATETIEPPVEEATAAPAQQPPAAEPNVAAEPQDQDDEPEEQDEIVDLDEVELPKKVAQAASETENTGSSEDAAGSSDTFDLDLDDIDALLDAEIARHQSPNAGDNTDEEDLDLSKP